MAYSYQTCGAGFLWQKKESHNLNGSITFTFANYQNAFVVKTHPLQALICKYVIHILTHFKMFLCNKPFILTRLNTYIYHYKMGDAQSFMWELHNCTIERLGPTRFLVLLTPTETNLQH